MTFDEFMAHDRNKNYCEIVIGPDGSIHYASPAHIYKLIALSGYTQEELQKIMPMSASPIHWLCEFTGYGSVWFEHFIMPIGITAEQVNVLEKLASAGKIHPESDGVLTQEKSLCEAMSEGRSNEFEKYKTISIPSLKKLRYFTV